MIGKNKVRIAITMTKDELAYLDDVLDKMNKISKTPRTRSSLLVSAFFILIGRMKQEQIQEQESKEVK